MIRKNQKQLNRLNALSDGVLVWLSYLFASWLWLDVIRDSSNLASVHRSDGNMVWVALLYAVWTVIMLTCFKLYRTSRIKGLRLQVRGILLGNALSILLVAALLYLFRLTEFSRGVLAVFYLTVCTVLTGKRLIMRFLLRRMRSRGYNLKHMLVVGGGELAQRYARAVAQDSSLGIRVDAILPVGEMLAQTLEERLHGDGIDEVILALEPEETQATVQVIQLCEKSGVKVSIVPFYNDVIPTQPTIDVIGDLKLMQLRTTPLDEPLNALLKRSFDVLISGLLLVLLSPLLLLIALAVRLSSPGPVLFRQERVGLNKRHFLMYKFRSMRVNDAQDTAWSTRQDDRRTWVGSLLRKTSLDELPQLWNVFRGEMSLVGPRPEIPRFVEQFRETVPLYMVKYQVRPGITGWAQIHGLRGDTSIPARVEHDLWYIEHWTLGLDIRIIFRTVFGGMINQEELARPSRHQDTHAG